MKKKTILLIGALFLGLTSCSDFFEPETSDALTGDDYMSDLNEMATGYLGVLTRMQAAGDKEIYLTDTRGEMLEPTSQSTAELIALYNYEDNLSGNSYADPALYYDVVIACNDYIRNMIEFNASHPELIAQTDYFPGLLASALRVKVWAYLTLGEIYGQALWFDDPIVKMQDVTNSSVFTLLPMEQILDRCIAILENGYEGFSPKENFSWVAWIDPENVTNISNSAYRYWDQMTPPYEALMAKCKIWSAAYKERNGQNAEADYQAVLDQLLPYLDNEWQSFHHYWKRAGRTPNVYNNMYNFATPNQEESVSAIIYDYTKNQTNRLLYHFSNEYPNAYLLTTNEAARAGESEYILQAVDQVYGKVYRREGGRLGFHTNVKTKRKAVAALIRALRDGSYIERDIEAVNEMRDYQDHNGRYAARPGKHDDILMTRAIGLLLMDERRVSGSSEQPPSSTLAVDGWMTSPL